MHWRDLDADFCTFAALSTNQSRPPSTAMKLTLDSSPSALAATLVAIVSGYTSETLTLTQAAPAIEFDGQVGSVEKILTAIASKRAHPSLLGTSDAEKAQIPRLVSHPL